MKRLFSLFAGLAVLAILAGCPATMQSASPGQNAINLTATSCKDIDAAIVGTDQAVLAGALKKSAAQEALKGLTALQAGCAATLAGIQSASAAANPASGATK